MVFAMAVVVDQLFTVLSHLVTLPVIPESVKVPELAPEHTVLLLLKVPPSEAAFTVTLTVPVYFVCPHDITLLRYHLSALNPAGGLYAVPIAPPMLDQPLVPLADHCHW